MYLLGYHRSFLKGNIYLEKSEIPINDASRL